jgi:hypothetical protein
MIAKSADEIQGFEYDWLASDEDGHVALFSTAGKGFAPVEFLRDTDAHDTAIEAILDLPISTSARFAPELRPGLKNPWRMAAERGLFAFECDPNGIAYRIVAAPVIPIPVHSLPGPAADVATCIKLRLRFEAQSVVNPELLGEDV